MVQGIIITKKLEENEKAKRYESFEPEQIPDEDIYDIEAQLFDEFGNKFTDSCDYLSTEDITSEYMESGDPVKIMVALLWAIEDTDVIGQYLITRYILENGGKEVLNHYFEEMKIRKADILNGFQEMLDDEEEE